MPTQRPVPVPRRQAPAERDDTQEGWNDAERDASRTWEAEGESATPAPPPRRADLPDPGKQQVPAGLPHDPAGVLRMLLLPRVESLEHRLAAARHRTSIDDRLDREPPALRFRVEPWTAPFDEMEERPGTVLEVVHEGGGEGSVTASIWCDPTSSQPTHRRSMPAAELTAARIDELLYDFVETALRERGV